MIITVVVAVDKHKRAVDIEVIDGADSEILDLEDVKFKSGRSSSSSADSETLARVSSACCDTALSVFESWTLSRLD